MMRPTFADRYHRVLLARALAERKKDINHEVSLAELYEQAGEQERNRAERRAMARATRGRGK